MKYCHRPRVLNDKKKRIAICPACAVDIKHKTLPKGYSLVFGDPFLVENVSMDVFNPGNNDSRYWGNNPFEESILLSAQDGAKALLYDSTSIYYFGQQ